MTYERFTDRARRVMQLANQEVQRLNHDRIGAEHILVGLLREGTGTACHVLRALDQSLCGTLLRETLVQMHAGPDKVTMGKLPQDENAKRVIQIALKHAERLRHNHVGTEHLLLGLVNVGLPGKVLGRANLDEVVIDDELKKLLGTPAVNQEVESTDPLVLLVREFVAKAKAEPTVATDEVVMLGWFARAQMVVRQNWLVTMTPNEVRKMRGREPYSSGGDDPMSAGKQQPAPLTSVVLNIADLQRRVEALESRLLPPDEPTIVGGK